MYIGVYVVVYVCLSECFTVELLSILNALSSNAVKNVARN